MEKSIKILAQAQAPKLLESGRSGSSSSNLNASSDYVGVLVFRLQVLQLPLTTVPQGPVCSPAEDCVVNPDFVESFRCHRVVQCLADQTS